MFNKRQRPWDKGVQRNVAGGNIKRRSSSSSSSATTGSSSSSKRSSSEQEAEIIIPYVELKNGIKYYSDRFYINKTIYDNNNDTNHNNTVYSSSSSSSSSNCCTCGANNNNNTNIPLFDRSAVIDNLNIKAVIVGTYTFDLHILKKEFPSIFNNNNNKDSNIPCLILHGKKGWTIEKAKQKYYYEKNKYNNDDDEFSETPNEDDLDKHFTDDATTTTTTTTTSPNKKPIIDETTETTVTVALDDHCSSLFDLPSNIHFSEITPTWLPSIPTNFSDAVCSKTGYLKSNIVENRIRKTGVHHPKYMIIIEQSGSIVVMISTANFTSQYSIDGTWIQRFPPKTATAAAADDNKDDKSSNNNSVPSYNDFGSVLTKFLQHEMLATAQDQVTIHWFVQQYLQWKSILDFERLFDYNNAQVHLIPTVPGEYNINTSHFHFGPQRVSKIVKNMNLTLESSNDKLIIQPTSLGGEWNPTNMSNLLRTYLNDNNEDETSINLDRLDIVWPTDYFIQQAAAAAAAANNAANNNENTNDQRTSPNSVVNQYKEVCFKTERQHDMEDDDNDEAATRSNGCGYLFLSSETFNSISLTCLSRLVMYEPAMTVVQQQQQNNNIPPHIKTICRLYKGNDYRIRKYYNIPKCNEYISWFILTSACLSRGAQGETINRVNRDCNIISYSNFELGILFTSSSSSQITTTTNNNNNNSTNKIYCYKPTQCTCNNSNNNTKTRLVHLPIPYCLQSTQYIQQDDDEDNLTFCETPYMHLITPGTANSGNMQLTPYYGSNFLLKEETNNDEDNNDYDSL